MTYKKKVQKHRTDGKIQPRKTAKELLQPLKKVRYMIRSTTPTSRSWTGFARSIWKP